MTKYKNLFYYLSVITYFLSDLTLFRQGEQSNFSYILWPLIFSCLSYYYLVKWYEQKRFILVLILGISVRCAATFFLPHLSMDFYRYWWDAHVMDSGVNPFLHTPKELMEHGMLLSAKSKEYYKKLNSPEYRSVYPSFCQGIFYIAYKLSGNEIYRFSFLLKIMTILFEIPGALAIFKILKVANKPSSFFFLYFLNPLIIIECFGNLHFELILCSLMMAGILLLFEKKYFISGLVFGISVITKIYSAILLPIMIFFDFRKSTSLLLGLVFPLLTMTFFLFNTSSNFGGYNLYMKQFEFNSSLFLLCSKLLIYLNCMELWNYRGLISIFFFSLTSLWILSTRVMKIENLDEFLKTSFYFFVVFILANSTVHPWYFIPLIITGIFSFPYFSLYCTSVAMLSYMFYDLDYSMYFEGFRILEYTLGILVFLYEKKNPYSWNRGS